MRLSYPENTVPRVPTIDYEKDLVITKDKSLIIVDDDSTPLLNNLNVALKNYTIVFLDMSVCKPLRFLKVLPTLWKFC